MNEAENNFIEVSFGINEPHQSPTSIYFVHIDESLTIFQINFF